MHLLLRNEDLERLIQDQRTQIDWLTNTAMSTSACLEIEAANEELQDLIERRTEIKDERVIEVFEYALEHLMTKLDRQKLALMKQTTHYILTSKLNQALARWQDYIQRMHDFEILLLFVNRYRFRTVIGAFRQWEFVCVKERARERRGTGQIKFTAKKLLNHKVAKKILNHKVFGQMKKVAVAK